jgi:hypothetical protein
MSLHGETIGGTDDLVIFEIRHNNLINLHICVLHVPLVVAKHGPQVLIHYHWRRDGHIGNIFLSSLQFFRCSDTGGVVILMDQSSKFTSTVVGRSLDMRVGSTSFPPQSPFPKSVDDRTAKCLYSPCCRAPRRESFFSCSQPPTTNEIPTCPGCSSGS